MGSPSIPPLSKHCIIYRTENSQYVGDKEKSYTESSEVDLILVVAEADADEERLDHLTGLIMRDLRDLGVESVERSAGEAAPEGAKGDPFTWGALALAVVPALLPKLVEFLQGWTSRPKASTIRLKTPGGVEVEFTPAERLTADQLAALVEKLSPAQG